ncbi:MAG: CinA family protein [Clostridiales bacterium]|nr:CinA family protein [Clostridiales bacterium]
MQSQKLVNLLLTKKLKIATAESCTGGLLAKNITDTSGASAVFDMGIVSYANEIKNKFLNVPNEVLNTVGAVSEETAEAMARGIVEAASADIGVGITGIAGPTGGTPEKPVGLVYYSIYIKQEDKIIIEKLLLNGSREDIRNGTVNKVIERLISELER